MRQKIAIATIVLTGAGAVLAHAQDQVADPRYQLEKTDEGYVRLDRQTGAMSLCRQQSDQLVCKVAADEREAYNEQMDALQNRIDKLERRVDALEKGAPEVSEDTPPDEEFNRSLAVIKRVFQHFVDMVKELHEELKPEQPQNTEPSRT